MTHSFPGKIKGSPRSTCTRRVLTVAYEHDVTIPVEQINYVEQEHKKYPYLDLQPFGQIPVLVQDDGYTVFESRAIARYIDILNGGKLLFINDPKKYAKVENWISVETFKFDPHASGIAAELVFAKFYGRETDNEKLEEHKKNLHTTLAVYDGHLAKNEYLIGSDVSLADLVHLPYATMAFQLVPEYLEKYSNVKRWFEAISNRPAWKKANPPTLNP